MTGLLFLAAHFFVYTIIACNYGFLEEVARGAAGFLMQTLLPSEFFTEQV